MTTVPAGHIHIGSTEYTEPHSGFKVFNIQHGSGKSSCAIEQHGATLCSWKVLKQELLFMSPNVIHTKGKALRGGVPVVFPQFGPGVLPQHGWVRAKLWHHNITTINKSTGDVTTEFTIQDDDETRSSAWSYQFELRLTIVLKLNSISQQLIVVNKSQSTFEFTCLLHSYLNVSDIHKTSVHGLRDIQFVDKVENASRHTETREAIRFQGEVDRVYENCGDRDVSIKVDDENASILLKCTGFTDVVVWNPGNEKAAQLSDLGEEAGRRFVCVEAGCVSKPIKLEAGKEFKAAQGFSLQLSPEATQLLQQSKSKA